VTTTLLGLFFVPLYFVTILQLFKVRPVVAASVKASPEPELKLKLEPAHD